MAKKILNTVDQARIGVGIGSNETLAKIVLDRVDGSHVKAMHVLGFIAYYGVFVEQNGTEPRSINQVAMTGRSKRSRATIDRWGQTFREAFPEYAMPSHLWAIARGQVADDFDRIPTDEDVLSLQLGSVRL